MKQNHTMILTFTLSNSLTASSMTKGILLLPFISQIRLRKFTDSISSLSVVADDADVDDDVRLTVSKDPSQSMVSIWLFSSL